MVSFCRPTLPFATELSPPPIPRKSGKNKLSITSLQKFLKEEHGIILSYDFIEELRAAHHQHSDTNFFIPSQTLDSIIYVCRYWEQFLSNKSDFNNLLCRELISMAKVHASVFSVYFIEKAGFELVAEKPAISYAIIINSNGNCHELR